MPPATLARVLECERAGVYLDDAQTVADYLVGWLDAKARRLKPTTIARCVATLSSALNDAIRQRRLTHNAARYAAMPPARRAERPCWTIEEAATFLRYCHQVDDPLTELYELLICTGMRKGEALGLHWVDVDLDARLLFVRHTPRRGRQQPPRLQHTEDHR